MSRSGTVIRTGVLVLMASLALATWPAVAGAASYEWVSVSAGGSAGNGDSRDPCISADGRYVAFESRADDLVLGDTNGTWDVFVRDRVAGTTSRVSVATGGAQANGASGSASLSGDGRYVAFWSEASDLVPGDTNGCGDAFVHDRQTGATVRVSVATGGAQGSAESRLPCISADGGWVAFESDASDLVPDDTNGCCDIFIHDRATGTTVRVSVATDGTQADGESHNAAISGDGGCIAFASDAGNLAPPTMYSSEGAATTGPVGTLAPIPPQPTTGTHVFVHDRSTGASEEIILHYPETGLGTRPHRPAVSSDGTRVAFSLWVGGVTPTAYVYDRVSTVVQSYRLADDEFMEGGPGALDASLSADGRYAAVSVHPTDTMHSGVPVPLVVLDLQTGTSQSENMGTGASMAQISGDGRCVAFETQDAWDPADDNQRWDIYLMRSPGLQISLRGRDRYETAAMISRAAFPEPRFERCPGLVLASGESFEAALCGGPLAAAYGGPVLLTPPWGLSPGARMEIYRLAPEYVICIGLSKALTDWLQGPPVGTVAPNLGGGTPSTTTGTTLPGSPVSADSAAASTGTWPDAAATGDDYFTTTTHLPVTTNPGPLPWNCQLMVIDGTNVYEMSYRVALALKAKLGSLSGATAIITPGDRFPDAVGVAPLACANRWPVLLTGPSDTDTLSIYAAIALAQTGIHKAIKVGTYVNLPAGIEGLANLSGADRYETNRNVAEWAEAHGGLSFYHLGLATGDKFPDGLAAGPYLALEQGILLLSPLSGLPPVVSAEIGANADAIRRVTFFAMIEPVIGQVKALLP